MIWFLSSLALASSTDICKVERPVSMEELRTMFDVCIIPEGTRITIYIEEVDSQPSGLGIGFMPGETKLTQKAQLTLDGILSVLNLRPSFKIKVIGFADASEIQFKHPEELSVERARVAADFLISKGVDASRILIEGMGASAPLDTSGTPEGQALNRRVEFVVISTKSTQ